MIRKLFLGIIVNGLAVYSASYLLPNSFILEPVDNIYLAIAIAGIVLGILNAIIKPIIKLFSLPFIAISMGLFYLVINAGILWLLAYTLQILQTGVYISITGFADYIIAGIIIAVVNTFLNWLTKK